MPDPELRSRLRSSRLVRASAYATFAWAFWCLLWLPSPLMHDAAGWHWNLESLPLELLYVAIGVETRRGSSFAIGISALLGATALWGAAHAIFDVLTGADLQAPAGVSIVVGRLMVVPFALAWAGGPLALWRAWRRAPVAEIA